MSRKVQRQPSYGVLAWAEHRGHWLKGCFPEYSRDPQNFYRHVREAFGDWSRIRMTAFRTEYLLAHPDAVEHVLKTQHENYGQPKERNLLFDGSLLTSRDFEIRRHRAVIQPCYSGARSALKCPTFIESANRFIERVDVGSEERVNLYEETLRLCLEIASISLFSRDLADPELEFHQKIKILLHYSSHISERAFTPAKLPWSRQRTAFLKARESVNREIGDIIRTHRDATDPFPDFLSEIIERAPATFNLHENAFLLLLASYLTISDALHFALQQLAINQSLQNDVFDEIENALGGKIPGVDDLSVLPLAEAVFKESLRLFGNFNLFQIAKEDDEINGLPIPAGSRVCLSASVTHRHPDFWDEPERFHPERFFSSDVLKHKYSYFPFGGGPRLCVGKTLAMVEGPLLLILILQRFQIDPANDNGGCYHFRSRSSQ